MRQPKESHRGAVGPDGTNFLDLRPLLEGAEWLSGAQGPSDLVVYSGTDRLDFGALESRRRSALTEVTIVRPTPATYKTNERRESLAPALHSDGATPYETSSGRGSRSSVASSPGKGDIYLPS